MLERQRGKQNAQRIDLNYFRRRTWLSRFRTIAVVTGLLVAGLYGAWLLAVQADKSPGGSVALATHLSTGPLSRVHAHFENDCQSCHGDQLGVALASDAWQTASEQRLQLQESKCQECHRVDGHARAMLAQPELDRDCARCHRDHTGRHSLLTNVENKTCTDCHGNLQKACRTGAQTDLLSAVTEFSISSHTVPVGTLAASAGNVEKRSTATATFRSLREDRGRVRFDHAQHMRPGQVNKGDKGGFQLNMLSPAVRSVYAQPGQAESDLVQLDCSKCHQPHAVQESRHASAIAREGGRFYAPIDFEKHCAACHQMSFAGQTTEELPLPHVAHREEFARLISAKQFSGSPRGKVREPGDRAAENEKGGASDAERNPAELPQEKLEAAVDAVFARCGQCHLKEDTEPDAIAKALAGTLQPLIPPRWLQHGYFDHASHSRLTRCAYCHEMPTAVGEPNDQHAVLIKGPESCVPCHRPPNAQAPQEFASPATRMETLGQKDQPTWASDDCITCHRYHWSRAAAPDHPEPLDASPPSEMLTGGSSPGGSNGRLP